MKKGLIGLILAFCGFNTCMAQAPQDMNYQAIVRNASGQVLPGGQTVSLRFQIHDGSPTGTVVFQEVASAVTNQFGLVTHIIGSGSNLATVNWGTGPKYLQIELDPAGGVSYADMGTSQLISVPYALFAANSEPGPSGPTGSNGSNGLNGATGIAGAAGLNGATGATGATGSNGVIGPIGATGAIGATGNAGAVGATGPAGNNGLNGATGAPG